jgi:hypothetical protein
VHGDQIPCPKVLELAIERKKVSALAHRPYDVDARSTVDRLDALDAVIRVVMRGPEEIGHAGVDDEELLAATPLSV